MSADEGTLAATLASATVIRPGDRVLLTTNKDVSEDESRQVVELLRGAFPGVDFVLAAGFTGIAIDRQDETDDEEYDLDTTRRP